MNDDLQRRALAVFGEAGVAGFLLGAAAGSLAVVAAGIVEGDSDLMVLVFYALIAAGFGGAVGLVVGMVAGVALYQLVRRGELRFGAHRVARLFPAVALVVTLPPTIAIGLLGDAAFFAGVVVVVAVLTIGGAFAIARRYRRRAEAAHLH